MHKISIISPVYNNGSFLDESISGMLNQTYKNLEIILVNDGSTDNSLEILNKYAEIDSRIKIIDKKNTGAGDSRNIGLNNATGEYTIFLDSDDIFYPQMIENSYNKIIEDNSDIVFFNYYEFDHNTKIKKLKVFMFHIFERDNVKILSNQSLKKYSLGITSQTPWNKLYKTSFLKKNDLKFSNIPSNNDVSFITNAFFVANKIVFLNKPLLEYRINTGQSISSNRNKKPFYILNAIKEVEDFLNKNKLLEEFNDTYFNFAMSCILMNLKGASKCTKKKFYEQSQEFLLRKDFVNVTKKLNTITDKYSYKSIINNSYVKYTIKNKFKFLYQRRFKNGKVTYKVFFIPILQKYKTKEFKYSKILGIKI